MKETDRPAEHKDEPASRVTPPTQAGTFVRSGEYWTIGYAGITASLRDIKGLSYIQRLLRHPGEEFHALDLLSEPGTGPASGSDSGDARSVLGEPNISIGGLGDAGEMLDVQAKRDYKRRLLELREQLEDLRERGDHERGSRVESEIEFLQREIVRAVGLGGRDRRAGSAAERARLNVTRAIKAALQKISEHQASLGGLLEHSVRTGSFCRYVADPQVPINWQFSLEGIKASAEAESAAPLLTETNLRAFVDQTKFVGREAECAGLRRYVDQASRGEGRVVMIGGEAGVGKTRFAREIGTEASRKGFLVLAGSCYDRDDPVPFNPVVEILEALGQGSDRAAFRKVMGENASEMARLVPQMRRWFPDIPPPQELSAEQSREMLFAAVSELLTRAAASRPVLLLLEDLHWADEGTLSLLNYLSRRISAMSMMIVGTHRDRELDPAGPLARTLDELIRLRLLERINLRGLPQNAVGDMIRALNGREPPEALVTLIYSNTEGNPFFTEELFRHLVEQGQLTDSNGEFRQDLKLLEIDVPPSLRLVIGRRLARLSDETYKVLGAAAVIGRSFTFELLEASVRADPDALLERVEEAEKAGLIYSTLEYPETRFHFSHELIRQAVVSGLSAARRQRLHLGVADAIERIYADALEDQVNELAHHLWQAGTAADARKTVRYCAMAADRAIRQSAYDAALRYSQNAFELLKKWPDSKERARQELELQIDYGVALLATKGWYAPEVGNAYRRAYELCQTLGEDSRLFAVVFGLWSFHLVRGEHPKARIYADDMMRLAPHMPDDGMLVQAYWASGCSQFFMGQFVDAHANLEQGIGRYDRQRHRTLAFQFGQDPCMSCLCFDAMCLWMLGYPEQAELSAQKSLALARELGYPFSLTWCLEELTTYYLMRDGDLRNAAALIEEGIPLSQEHGYAQMKEGLLACRLIGLAAQGRLDAMTDGGRRPRGFSEVGYEIRQTWVRSVIAEALGNAGNIDAALALIAQASAVMERNEERYIEPEIHRIHGELLLKSTTIGSRVAGEFQSVKSKAEQSFLKAIEIARCRKAKMLELRAAVSLSRFLAQSGRAAEAARILSETCACFTEGRDTQEFRVAQNLLQSFAPITGSGSNG